VSERLAKRDGGQEKMESGRNHILPENNNEGNLRTSERKGDHGTELSLRTGGKSEEITR